MAWDRYNSFTVAFNGDTSFSYDWVQPAEGNLDMRVTVLPLATLIRLELIENTDYLVSGRANPSGGTVDLIGPFAAGLLIGDIITLESNLRPGVFTFFTDEKSFNAEALNNEFVRREQALEDALRLAERGIKLSPQSSEDFDTEFTPVAGKLISVNSAGDGLQLVGSAAGIVPLDDLSPVGALDNDIIQFNNGSGFWERRADLTTGAITAGAITATGIITAGSGANVVTTAAGLSRHQNIDPAIAGSGLSVASGVLSVDTVDHGALLGLGDDDHPQYALLAAVANTFTGIVTVEGQANFEGVMEGKGGTLDISRQLTPTESIFGTIQDTINLMHSAGWVNGGAIIDQGDGSILVETGSGMLRGVDDQTSLLCHIDWLEEEGSLVDLVDLDTNYIYVEWNGGEPRVIATTIQRFDFNTNILLTILFRATTTLHINPGDLHAIGDAANSIIRRFKATEPYGRETGGIVSETGTLNVAITAGVFWRGLTRFLTPAKDTSVPPDTFRYYFNDGDFQEIALQEIIDNDQFNDFGVGLATLSNNRFGVHWCFLEADGQGLTIVYGIGDFTLVDAQDEQPPASVPEHVEVEGILAAKIIIKKGDNFFTQLDILFDTTFTGSQAADHGDLTGLADDDHPQYALLAAPVNTFTGGQIRMNSLTPLFSMVATGGGEMAMAYLSGTGLSIGTAATDDTITFSPDNLRLGLTLSGDTGSELANFVKDITLGGTVDGRDVATDGTKLDGIESGATADLTQAEVKTLYELNTNTNEFSNAEQTKLSGIENTAQVNPTNAETKTNYEANSNTNEFSDAEQTKLAGIETSADVNPTNAQTKTNYEANANTNEFSDAEQTKLAGIEALAEVNPTNAETKTAYEANGNTNEFSDAEQTTVSNQSGVNTGDEPAASNVTAGIMEIATQAELETGSDNTRAISPLALLLSSPKLKNIIGEEGGTLTISSGDVTITDSIHTVTSETGAADDLANILGGIRGQRLFLLPAVGHTITFKHFTGGDGQMFSGTAADFSRATLRGVELVCTGAPGSTIWFISSNPF